MSSFFQGRSRWAGGLVLFGLMALALLWAVFQFGERYFLSESAGRGRTALMLHVENLRGWLDRYRALPRVYAQSAKIRAMLADPSDPARIEVANRFLVEVNRASGASDTYVLDASGMALAASNWADEKPFVGRSYSYRPYYRDALEGRLGHYFALGTVSHKRGYYFSYPVRGGGEIVGLVVVKVGVEAIEEDLRNSAHEVFVSDSDGVILLAGNPAWRLRSLGPLSDAAQARIARDRQFEIGALKPVDWRDLATSPIGVPRLRAVPDGPEETWRDFLMLEQAMSAEGWTVHLLVETGFAVRQTLIVVGLAAAVLLALALIAAIVWLRRRRFQERLAAKEEARVRLEQAVEQRTAELSSANRQLAEEVGERKAAEEELRTTQAELVQAGKLAALGQMSAALSHEFNQPLTAIRTYSDNAIAFLERGREEEAQANIELVSTLTERMAELSKHLSSFARKPQGETRPVSLTGALTETLALLQGRLDKHGLVPELALPDHDVWVLGGHVRLQQVIMNLVVNAVDAMAEAAEPSLAIAIHPGEEQVELIVEDRGDGIEPGLLETIFDPFFTTKGVGQGLGLGLSISFNIIKDFGGTITATNRPDGGARFVVRLRPAEAVSELAAE